MRRLVRAAAVLALAAGLLPTYAAPATAHHDNLPGCAAERRTGYIPVAQNDPVDATTLHYQVLLPKTGADENGKFGAVIDYSGYQPGLHIWDGLDDRFLCEGYAVVGLNIRGTGCSGGVFDYFEPRQAEDGREAIEWLAERDWSNGRLAMVGKSYPGITQLFVAGQPHDDDGDGEIDGNPPTETEPGTGEWNTTPKGLVALVPGHVFGDLYRDVPYPGGIMNVTFASYWSAQRIVEPLQAPVGDQLARNGFDVEDPESWPEWDPTKVDPSTVDQQCMANAAQHAANPPMNPFVKAVANQYDGPLYKERSPWYWADAIDVPTFLIQTWQDEQVGSRASELIERFRSDLEWRALFTNGDHGEYYSGAVFPEITEFLRFYLAREVPDSFPRGTVEVPVEPTPEPTPTPSPSETLPNGKPRKPKGKPSPSPSPTPTPSPSTTTRPETDAEVLARYEAEPPVHINWETRDSGPAASANYQTWPPRDEWRLYFRPSGELVGSPPSAEDAGTRPYNYDPVQGSQVRGYELTDGVQIGDWSEYPADGTYAMFETQPLQNARVVGGPASVDLWLSSTSPDTDLQVTLTEVRPDGQEMFVQQGWLRASHRTLDEDQSTAIRPYQTHAAEDAATAGPLLPEISTPVRVEVFPFAHIFRAGSKLRLYVEAPHVKPDLWGFALLPVPAINTIHISPDEPSSIVLPLVGGDEAVPPGMGNHPANCGLLNQPCREAL